MARNRSEKNPEPVLEGCEQWLMEPIRLDALHREQLDGYQSGGDTVFLAWTHEQREAYMQVHEDVRTDCYNEWLAYYKRNPDKRIPL